MTQQFGLGRSIGVAQGLQGLQRGQLKNEAMQQQMGFQQEDRAAAEAEARRKQLLQERLQGVMNPETGQLDPAGFTDLLLTDPEVAGTVREQFGLMDEQRNQQTLNKAFGAKQILDQAGTPEEALGILQQQGYMDDPLFSELADNLQAGDVEGARNELGYGIAAIGGREAYEDAFGTPAAAGGLDIGKFNPRDYTTESFAEFMQTQDPTVLERYADQRSIEIGGVPHRFDPALGGYFPAEVAGGEQQPATEAPPGGQPGTEVTAEDVGESRATIIAAEEREKLKSELAKQGLRMTPEGNLEPIPGGAPAQEQAQAEAARKEQRRQSFEKTETMLTKIDDSLEQVDWSSAGAVGQVAGVFGGTPARDLSTNLDTIKANLGFDALQDMRDASPTGGALGQVTEKEIAFLQSLVESLDQSQSPSQLRSNLRRLRSGVQKTRDMLTGEIQVVESQEEIAGLPNGSQYVLADDPARAVVTKGNDNDVDTFLDQELERLGL